MAPTDAVVASTQGVTDEALTVQIQQFLDEWYYRIIHCSVGKAWSRKKAVALLLDICEMVGMSFPPEEKESLTEAEDDQSLTNAMIASMPEGFRDRWEAVALQLQTVLHEASRIRSAAEDSPDAVSTLFDESGSSQGGLTQQVLKASVICAAKEVSKFRRIHTTWKKNTDARIDRLLGASEEAEHCQQQLLSAEAQLSEIRGDSKAKGKGVLMNMAEGNNKTLIHTCFSSWFGLLEKAHAEAAIRQRFQDQIDNATKKLLQYKEAQIANIRGVLMRGAMEDQDVLMHMVWKFWMDEVNERKADGDTAEALKAVQDKLNSFEAAQKENAGKFMTRMAAGNDESLKNLCLEAWIKFHQDYAQDKEYEDKVKAQEANFKAHMDAKKDEAKAVMDRMLAGTAQGLLALIIQNWVSWLKDEKKQKELEFALNEAQAKFKTLNGRQKAGASNVQNRVNDQINANLQQRIFNCWIVETKANRVENHYNTKYESKKRQLQGVQNLFKSFAMQLEQNLGGDEDSSSRTDRKSRKSKKESSNSMPPKGSEGTVSLPDINQKPAA
jgi:hypothetical protein